MFKLSATKILTDWLNFTAHVRAYQYSSSKNSPIHFLFPVLLESEHFKKCCILMVNYLVYCEIYRLTISQDLECSIGKWKTLLHLPNFRCVVTNTEIQIRQHATKTPEFHFDTSDIYFIPQMQHQSYDQPVANN